MRIDFHVHSKYSIDTMTEPKLIVEKARGLGLCFACTDHNSTRGHAEFRRLGARFIPGEEISTDAGDLIGLYLNEAIPKRTPLGEAMDRIRAQGGLAYLPHMFDLTRKGVGEREEARRADIVEVFNPRCIVKGFNAKAREFAEKNKKLMAAGSDSHTIWEFGKTYTEMADFDIENEGPKELLRALKSAKIVGVPAPLYVRGMADVTKVWKRLTGIGRR